VADAEQIIIIIIQVLLEDPEVDLPGTAVAQVVQHRDQVRGVAQVLALATAIPE
jgi:hypothetical protein